MDKDQVVELMTNTVVAWNRQMAEDQKMPQDTLDSWIENAIPQFKYVNSMLYDALVSNGIIK
jgi:hypothetical protein